MAIIGVSVSDKQFLELEQYWMNNKNSASMGEFYGDMIIRKVQKNKNKKELDAYTDNTFFKSIVKK